MRSHRWIAMSSALALGLMPSTPALAQTSELPVYVSDQFRSVAKEASEQLITAHIASACPDNKPLCKSIVEQLAAATGAAISKDRAGLERALNTFFILSTVAGFVEVVMGDLTDTEVSQYPALAQALAPVTQCLAASVVAGRQAGQTLKECELEREQLKELKDEAQRLVCEVNPRACPVINDIILGLEQRPVQVGRVVFGLAQMIEGAPFHRQKESIYLYSLGEFLEDAPENGLFEATWSFLTTPDRKPWVWERVGVAEKTIASGAFLEYRFLNGTEDAQILQLLKACGQPTELYEAWIQARANLPALREALLIGSDIQEEIQPLARLLKYTQCNGTEDQRRQLRAIHSQVQYILVPLEFRSALKRYGVIGLSAAAILDYVRSSNSQKLDLDIARTLAFGVAQAAATRQTAQRLLAERTKAPAPDARLTGLTALGPGDLLGTCEFQRVSSLLGQPYTVTDLTAPRCFDLYSRRLVAGNVDLVEIAELDDPRIEVEARAFVQLLKHAYFQQHTPPGGLTPELLAKLVDESELFLGEVMASRSPAVSQAWPDIREALNRIHASSGDLDSRSKLQARAFSLASSVKAPATGPRLSEESFLELMLDQTTTKSEARLEAFWQQWLARKRQLEALEADSAAGQPELAELAALHVRSERLPPLRQVRALLEYTDAQRAVEMFKVLRGVLRATTPEQLRKIEEVEEKLAAKFPIRELSQAIQDGVEQRSPDTRRRVMRIGADFLVVQADMLALRVVGGDVGRCQQQDPKWRSILNRLDSACTAHLLIQGAYHPIADYLSAGGYSAPGTSKLADTTYRQLLQSPVLGSTPLILNVGLGANWVGFNRPESDSLSLTVVDKFGVALLKYNGPSYGFEVGPFVGGFLDALVRTAAGADEKYWLGGLTVGFPRIAGMDIGLEAHAAGAFPFSFHSDPRLTLGLTVVVPFNAVLDSND
jgi:hypothetical protein